MKSKNSESLHRAKNYAFLLLKFRPRSKQEIYRRLKRKNFDEKIIKDTLAFLREKDFINDESFAKSWIESRLKKPLGLRRIKEELKIKGIDRQIIDNQIQAIKKDYSEEDIVAKLAGSRFNRLKGIEPEKAKRRIFSYLLRRGFSADVVMDVISQI